MRRIFVTGVGVMLAVMLSAFSPYLAHRRASFQAAGGGYTPQTAGFDGTGDFLSYSSPLTGASDSASFTVSFWYDSTGEDSADQHIYWSSGNGFEIIRLSDNTMQVRGESGGGTDNLIATTSVTQVAAEGWAHWLITGNGTTLKFYKNGTLDGSSVTSLYSGTAIDFANSESRIGAGNSGADDIAASLADFWFDDSANDVIGDYYSAGPVDLGSDGSTPTGAAPVFYLSRNGSGNSWAVDSSGNGNTFTVTGGPLTSPTAP